MRSGTTGCFVFAPDSIVDEVDGCVPIEAAGPPGLLRTISFAKGQTDEASTCSNRSSSRACWWSSGTRRGAPAIPPPAAGDLTDSGGRTDEVGVALVVVSSIAALLLGCNFFLARQLAQEHNSRREERARAHEETKRAQGAPRCQDARSGSRYEDHRGGRSQGPVASGNGP